MITLLIDIAYNSSKDAQIQIQTNAISQEHTYRQVKFDHWEKQTNIIVYGN